MKLACAARIFAISALVMLGCAAEQNEKTVIDGVLVDAKGAPVINARVVISRGGRTVPGKSDDKGYYKVEIDSGAPFDILYSHSDTGDALVTALSGNKKQHINKVLYKSSQLTAEAIHEQLQLYERMLFLAANGGDVGKEMIFLLDTTSTRDRIRTLVGAAREAKINKAASELLTSKASSVQDGHAKLVGKKKDE